MDIRHRRSISGIIMMLAGGAIAWLCRVQITISLSTTESEILSASDAGRLALYLRSVLADLGYPQHHATVIFEDNRATVLISQAAHPTRQTRHIDIREFALLDWNDCGLIILESLDTTKKPPTCSRNNARRSFLPDTMTLPWGKPFIMLHILLPHFLLPINLNLETLGGVSLHLCDV